MKNRQLFKAKGMRGGDIFLLSIVFFIFPLESFAWKRHDLMTSFIVKDVSWLNLSLTVTPFKPFLTKAFSKDFTEADFFNQYQLNPKTVIGFEDIKKFNKVPYARPSQKTLAREILSNYVDEPDWGMDQDLNLSPDQKYMGGYTGPTSQGFRHIYFKKWSIKAPWRTFHVPTREMGEALKRAQLFYDLAEQAWQVGEPYWSFRFLAWSLHYVQDLGQPFHSSQILTPKFLSWDDIFNFKKFVSRTTQIIANYHSLYEDYAVYQLKEEKIVPMLLGIDFFSSSSAFLIAKHAADFSNHDSQAIGNLCYTYFGRKFFDPSIKLAGRTTPYPIQEIEKEARLKEREKKTFLETTAKNLKKTAYYSRSLLELAHEEFLKNL